MVESSASIVVNAHHFGGVEKLPPGTVYIGRPSLYGNPYSTKSGKNTKEECVALHRIDLYRRLIEDKNLLAQIKADLEGHDLACWCVQPKKIMACHGFNYLHLLSDTLSLRTYDKTVVHYLMDDLRSVLTTLKDWVHGSVSQEKYLDLYCHVGDVRLSIERFLLECKDQKINGESLCFFLSLLVVDLELAIRDTQLIIIHYRFDHVLWNIYRFSSKVPEIFPEPSYPLSKG